MRHNPRHHWKEPKEGNLKTSFVSKQGNENVYCAQIKHEKLSLNHKKNKKNEEGEFLSNFLCE